jgi:hypothetical protein
MAPARFKRLTERVAMAGRGPTSSADRGLALPWRKSCILRQEAVLERA